MEWYLKVLKEHYADFNGRARRKEYWMFFLFNLLISYGILGISLLTGIEALSYISTLYSLAVFIPGIAVGIRRLHDVGKSGWWLFIALVPIVGIIWLIVLLATDGEHGENQWGPNPKGIGNQSAIDQIGKE